MRSSSPTPLSPLTPPTPPEHGTSVDEPDSVLLTSVGQQPAPSSSACFGFTSIPQPIVPLPLLSNENNTPKPPTFTLQEGYSFGEPLVLPAPAPPQASSSSLLPKPPPQASSSRKRLHPFSGEEYHKFLDSVCEHEGNMEDVGRDLGISARQASNMFKNARRSIHEVVPMTYREKKMLKAELALKAREEELRWVKECVHEEIQGVKNVVHDNTTLVQNQVQMVEDQTKRAAAMVSEVNTIVSQVTTQHNSILLEKTGRFQEVYERIALGSDIKNSPSYSGAQVRIQEIASPITTHTPPPFDRKLPALSTPTPFKAVHRPDERGDSHTTGSTLEAPPTGDNNEKAAP